jgi:aerobic carbon-monoxide dehydrogenase large subunit
VTRKEDQRFITGNGRYTDDITLPRQTYAAFVRSPHAHATIDRRRRHGAREGAGRRRGAHRRGRQEGRHRRPDLRLDDPFQGRLADERRAASGAGHGKVRYVGDHVAMVIAETLDQAQDAAELVEVSYGSCPPSSTPRRRSTPGQPQVHDAAPNNLSSTGRSATRAPSTRPSPVPSTSPGSTSSTTASIPNAIEPRAALGDLRQRTESFTLYTTSQNPHVARLVMAAFIGIAPEHKLRVIAPDVGGGFGSKIFIYAEESSSDLGVEEDRAGR